MNASAITIYHNPDCGTSRNTLALIRNSGEEPHVIEYLKAPPGRKRLVTLIGDMGVSVRSVLRQKGTPYDELKLDDATWTDDQLIDFIVEHPVLMNRPIVVTPPGHPLVPTLGSGARHPGGPSACGLCEGRRRTGHRRPHPPKESPCRCLI